MSINQLSAAALQSIVRRVIALDPESVKQLNIFSDKTIRLSISDMKLDYFIAFANRKITISEKNFATTDLKEGFKDNIEQDISATISGTLPAFIAAAAAEHSSDSIFKGELKFSGEVNTAKQFQAFAQSLNIDWQEPIAQLLGDPIAYTFANGIKHFSNWLFTSAKSSQQDIAEYLQEEARVTVSESEQQHHFNQVDQIRSHSDRLTARVNRLVEQSHESHQSPIEQESL